MDNLIVRESSEIMGSRLRGNDEKVYPNVVRPCIAR